MVRPNFSKRSHPPRRPFDKDRLIDEMKLVGTYGLRNKRELWTIQKDCNKTKLKARDLLICPNKQEQLVNGRALLNKLVNRGINEPIDFQSKQQIIDALNKVLNLTESNFLERRLQHLVFELGIATDVHQARCLIFQKQISIKGRVVNKPGFEVKKEDENFIELYQYGSRSGFKKGKRSSKEKEKDPYDEGVEE